MVRFQQVELACELTDHSDLTVVILFITGLIIVPKLVFGHRDLLVPIVIATVDYVRGVFAYGQKRQLLCQVAMFGILWMWHLNSWRCL